MKKSYYIKGQVMDFYIEGIVLSNICKVVLFMCVGGVGYYLCSNFVYIDIGLVWYW